MNYIPERLWENEQILPVNSSPKLSECMIRWDRAIALVEEFNTYGVVNRFGRLQQKSPLWFADANQFIWTFKQPEV